MIASKPLPLGALAGLIASVVAAGPACSPAAPSLLPGLGLAERVDGELDARASALRWGHLEHYALVAPVERADLARFMARISARPDGPGFALGAGSTSELHGGAVLGLLFAQWRPEGRAARPEDHFPFRPDAVALAAIYAGHRRQIFLPVPGRPAEAIEGSLPTEEQLPRMRFFADAEGVDPVERDAYSFLRLLVAREPDPAAGWLNHVDQELSVDLLLRHAGASYLRDTDLEAEAADHSRLHLVEILLAHLRRHAGERPPPLPFDAEEIQRRFLSVELRRPLASTDDERLVHYVESLGWLVAHPGLTWAEPERSQLRAWLHRLESSRFSDLSAVNDVHLTHLGRGLRALRTHGDRLGEI